MTERLSAATGPVLLAAGEAATRWEVGELDGELRVTVEHEPRNAADCRAVRAARLPYEDPFWARDEQAEFAVCVVQLRQCVGELALLMVGWQVQREERRGWVASMGEDGESNESGAGAG